jgi:CheY-like chemotaxis protein
LATEGYKVSVAYNGTDAATLVENQRPDLIITDLMMPGMNGLELIAYVRALPGASSLPIIIITADASGETHDEGLKAGANLLLTKPFDDDNLINSIETLLAL